MKWRSASGESMGLGPRGWAACQLCSGWGPSSVLGITCSCPPPPPTPCHWPSSCMCVHHLLAKGSVPGNWTHKGLLALGSRSSIWPARIVLHQAQSRGRSLSSHLGDVFSPFLCTEIQLLQSTPESVVVRDVGPAWKNIFWK